jgi:hypothetical protein
METHPALLSQLYSDCQTFAEKEIKSLLEGVDSLQKPRSYLGFGKSASAEREAEHFHAHVAQPPSAVKKKP